MNINRIKLIVALVLLLFSFLGMIQTLSLVYDFRPIKPLRMYTHSKNTPILYFYGIALFTGAYLLASIKKK